MDGSLQLRGWAFGTAITMGVSLMLSVPAGTSTAKTLLVAVPASTPVASAPSDQNHAPPPVHFEAQVTVRSGVDNRIRRTPAATVITKTGTGQTATSAPAAPAKGTGFVVTTNLDTVDTGLDD